MTSKEVPIHLPHFAPEDTTLYTYQYKTEGTITLRGNPTQEEIAYGVAQTLLEDHQTSFPVSPDIQIEVEGIGLRLINQNPPELLDEEEERDEERDNQEYEDYLADIILVDGTKLSNDFYPTKNLS